MCFAIVRFDPDAAWPVLLAFVRDEERSRTWSMPAAWWPEQPTVVGGRDDLAGGTWLALETDERAPRVSCVLNRREAALPALELEGRTSRGTLPLSGVHAGGFDAAPATLASMEPFSLLEGSQAAASWRHWSGFELSCVDLEPGWHGVTSHGLDAPNREGREQRWLPRFEAAPLPDPGAAGSTLDAWGEWVRLLDGRGAAIDDPESITIAGLSAHPGFGTVGGSLVAIAADGRTRFDANPAHDLDPARWVVSHPG